MARTGRPAVHTPRLLCIPARTRKLKRLKPPSPVRHREQPATRTAEGPTTAGSARVGDPRMPVPVDHLAMAVAIQQQTRLRVLRAQRVMAAARGLTLSPCSTATMPLGTSTSPVASSLASCSAAGSGQRPGVSLLPRTVIKRRPLWASRDRMSGVQFRPHGSLCRPVSEHQDLRVRLAVRVGQERDAAMGEDVGWHAGSLVLAVRRHRGSV